MPQEIVQDKTDFKVLFIGNSLTYSNDLPELVKEKAQKKGIKVETVMLAFPNYGLEDHLANKNLTDIISKGNFDYVVIQQGPSSMEDGRASLITFGKEIKLLCDRANAKLVYFMVWPPLSRYHTFSAVIDHYKEAAKVNDAILCPVGEVWKAHFENTQNFDYYGPDSFHPSLKGSQMAAQVIVDVLF